MTIRSLLLIGLLVFNTSVQAQVKDPEATRQILSYVEQGQPVPFEALQQIDTQQNDVQTQVDLVLKQLLSIPFEYRQYAFPALFDAPGIPKKIRTHPEIAIWEGKLPTRIAPEAQAYADRYLKDMSPQLFIYLSPESFKNTETDRAKQTYSSDLAIAALQAQSKIENQGEKIEYKRIEEVLQLPDDLQKNPNKQTLTEKHIKNLRSGLNAFNTFLNRELAQNDAFQSGYRNLARFDTDRYAEKINPFQEKLNRIRLLKKEKELDQALQTAGWKDATEFATITDTIIRAYRAANMSLPFAFEFRRYRNQTPKNTIEQMMVTMAKMHEALPADVHLVLDHLPKVRQDFIDTGYQSVLNAEMVDEFRK